MIHKRLKCSNSPFSKEHLSHGLDRFSGGSNAVQGVLLSLLSFFVLRRVGPEVTVTSLHPPRLCRLAVFSIKPTLLSHKYTLLLSLPMDPQQQQTHTAAAAEAGYEVDVAKCGWFRWQRFKFHHHSTQPLKPSARPQCHRIVHEGAIASTGTHLMREGGFY